MYSWPLSALAGLAKASDATMAANAAIRLTILRFMGESHLFRKPVYYQERARQLVAVLLHLCCTEWTYFITDYV